MAIEIISTLKPKNNGTFPIAEAKDITVDENGTRLDAKLTELANNAGSGGGIIDVTELPTEGIDTTALYRKPIGWLIYNNYINFADVYMVDTRPTTGEICTTDGQSINAVYYEVSTGEMIGYVNATVGAALSVPAGWYTAQQLMPALGQSYGGVIANITEATASNTFYLLLEYKTYYYKNRWFCTSKEIVKILLDNNSNVVNMSDSIYEKIQNDYQNIELYVTDNVAATLIPMFLSYRKGHEVIFSSVPYVCDVEIAPACSIIVDTKNKTCEYHAKLLTTTMYS